MDIFSQPESSSVATCAALSRNAQSTNTKIQAMISRTVVGNEAAQSQLRLLSLRLHQFRLHVDQLSRCLGDAPVIHKELGGVLASALIECQEALGIVLGHLEPWSGGLGVEALSCYEKFIAAQLRFFVFATQLLTM